MAGPADHRAPVKYAANNQHIEATNILIRVPQLCPHAVSFSTDRVEGFLGEDIWTVSLSLPGLQKSRVLGATKTLVQLRIDDSPWAEQQQGRTLSQDVFPARYPADEMPEHQLLSLRPADALPVGGVHAALYDQGTIPQVATNVPDFVD